MNPDLAKLIELQQMDREIARLNQEISALPRRVTAIEGKLAEARARAEKLQADLKSQEALRRKLELETQDLRHKISKYRDQSLEVKTNDQYRALMQEIEFAEKEIRSCEDRMLEAMLEIDSAEKELKSVQAELKAQAAVVEREKNDARARTAEDEQQLAEWQTRRDALRAGIDSGALLHYDRLLKLRKFAIAEVRDQKCSACNVVLRPQKYNEARTNQQILTCDSCGRILLYDAVREVATEAAVAGKGNPANAGSALS